MSEFIEKKVNIFISSKCGGKYSAVRVALKNLLEETNMCNVYVFEYANASSMNVERAYLSELEDSDVIIFLIDNKDGITEPVQLEINRARELKKKCLFFFCSEDEKEYTQLQKDIMAKGLEKYYEVPYFHLISEKAYHSAIEDIVKMYRQYCRGILEDTSYSSKRKEEIQEDNENALDSDISSEGLDEEFLVKQKGILIPISKNFTNLFQSTKNELYKQLGLFIEENIKESDVDLMMTGLMNLFLYDSESDVRILEKYKEWVLSIHTQNEGIVYEHRVNALQKYFVGDIEQAIFELEETVEIAQKTDGISQWIIDDIAMDLRNMQLIKDKGDGVHRINSHGQQLLDSSSSVYFNPVVDRMSSKFYESLFSMELNEKIKSPYTVNLGGRNAYVENAANIFCAAAYSVSFTHMNLFRKRLADFYINEAVIYQDHDSRMNAIRLLLSDYDEGRLSKFLSSYIESTNRINASDVHSVIPIIDRIPVEYDRVVARILLLRFFGYYLDDTDFEAIYHQTMNEVTSSVSEEKFYHIFVPQYLKALSNIQYRIQISDIVEWIYLIFEKKYRRWYDDVFELITNLGILKELKGEARRKFISWIVRQVKDKEVANSCHNLLRAAQHIRQTFSDEAKKIDCAVKMCNESFYIDIYSLNVFRHDTEEDWGYIRVLLNRLAKDNSIQGKNGAYYSTAYNDYITIINILIKDAVKLSNEQIKKVVTTVKGTLLSKTQTYEAKVSSVFLLQIIKVKNTSNRQIAKMVRELQDNSDIFEGEQLSFVTVYSQELLCLEWLILGELVGETDEGYIVDVISRISNMEIACQITYLDQLERLSKMCDGNKCLERTFEKLWASLLLLEKSNNPNVCEKISGIYANLVSSVFSERALTRLSLLLDDSSVRAKIKILTRIKKVSVDVDELINKGCVDNHFLVRKVALEN